MCAFVTQMKTFRRPGFKLACAKMKIRNLMSTNREVCNDWAYSGVITKKSLGEWRFFWPNEDSFPGTIFCNWQVLRHHRYSSVKFRTLFRYVFFLMEIMKMIQMVYWFISAQVRHVRVQDLLMLKGLLYCFSHCWIRLVSQCCYVIVIDCLQCLLLYNNNVQS